MRDTNAGTFARRSKELEALDKAILKFETDRSPQARFGVEAAFLKWKSVHSQAMTGVESHRRNAHGLLRALDLEFAESVAPLTPSAQSISRIRAHWPDNKRPPGAANVSDHMVRDRIDKAFVDTQVVLRSVVSSLERGGPDVTRLVHQWFGANATLTGVCASFDRIRLALNRYRDAGDAELEIRWPDRETDTAVAATGPGASYMQFGAKFFNDDLVVPATSLTARPGATPENLVTLRELGVEVGRRTGERAAHDNARRILDKARPSDNLGAAAQRVWDDDYLGDLQAPPARNTSYQDLMRQLAEVGYKATDPLEAARERLTTQVLRLDRERQRANDRYTAMGPVKYSASGVVIHELTHMVLRTEDVTSPTVVGMTCYGPFLCMDLAQVSSNEALKNADNYRLLAESLQI